MTPSAERGAAGPPFAVCDTMRPGSLAAAILVTSLLPACGDDGGATNQGVCGDAICSEDETDATCSADCGCAAVECSVEVAPYGCHCDALCEAKGDCCDDIGSAREMCPVAGPGIVVPVYLTATDTPADEVESVRATYEEMFAWVQTWYMLEMGADHGYKTFQVEPVRVFPSPYTRAEWDTFSRHGYPGQTETDGTCSMYSAAYHTLPDLLAAEKLPPIGSPGVLYYSIGGAGDNGSCGGGGLAASEEMVVTNARMLCPSGHYDPDGTDCSSVGVIAHEQGHAFGLPHASDRPDGCTGGPSVMDVWWDYDRGATLCEEDRVDLEKSGFFH